MHQNRKGNSYLSGVNTENRTGRSSGETVPLSNTREHNLEFSDNERHDRLAGYWEDENPDRDQAQLNTAYRYNHAHGNRSYRMR